MRGMRVQRKLRGRTGLTGGEVVESADRTDVTTIYIFSDTVRTPWE